MTGYAKTGGGLVATGKEAPCAGTERMVDFYLIACFIPVRTGPSVIELGLTRLRLSAALTLGQRRLIDVRE